MIVKSNDISEKIVKIVDTYCLKFCRRKETKSRNKRNKRNERKRNSIVVMKYTKKEKTWNWDKNWCINILKSLFVWKNVISSEHSGLETLPMNDKITRKGGEKEKIVRKRWNLSCWRKNWKLNFNKKNYKKILKKTKMFYSKIVCFKNIFMLWKIFFAL